MEICSRSFPDPESEKLSGLKPEYRLIDDAELMLTLFAANPPRMEGSPA